MHGITISNLFDQKLETKLNRLDKSKRFTARVVIDDLKEFDFVRSQVSMIANYCDLMIQIQDSFGEKDLSDEELFLKAERLFSAFQGECRLWEIGNEINGEWCSPSIALRVKTIWMMMPQDHKALITLFGQNNLKEWYEKNPFQTDYVGLSYYPSQYHYPHHTALESFEQTVRQLNPNAKTLVSECGSEEIQDLNSTPRTEARLLGMIKSVRIDSPSWVGGYFPWDWQKHGITG